jgi:hypothetical protein
LFRARLPLLPLLPPLLVLCVRAWHMMRLNSLDQQAFVATRSEACSDAAGSAKQRTHIPTTTGTPGKAQYQKL